MMLLDRQDNFDIDEAQSRLDVLSGELSNSFSCNVWEFDSYGKWFIKLDFGDLEFLAERNTDWPLGQKVDWVLLTKVVWLSMISATTHHGLYVARLHGLKLFWAAMSRFRIAQVSKENGAEVLRFLLTHSWGNGTERKNLSLKSYSRFSEHFRLEALKASLLDMGLEWISRDLTDSFVKRQLKALIPKLTADELTFRDWREGGSFNLLTLDYGRYFVEHCFEFFEQHYPLASALATTFQSLPEIADSVGYKLPTVSQPSSFFLRGFSSEELKLRWPDFSIKTLRIVEEKICQTFKSAYKDARFEGRILKDENLEVLLQTLGVRSSHENVDRMRVILWNWISRVDRGETESLLLECQSPISMARFEDELTKLRERFDQEPVEMPSDRYYRRIGLSIASTSDSLSYPRSLIYLTLKAGFTSFIALTGWRQSEYGFALKAIKRTINEDKLDQYAFPWRYQVDWVVPKHHGEILQLREVTFGAVFLAERIKTLIGANDDQPCLYAVNAGKRDAHSSEGSVRRAVRALWGNFVFHYKGFKEVDDWNSWHRIQSSLDSGESLTNRERSELQRLLAKRDESEWSRLSIDINLKEARQRALAEWPRLEIFFAANRAARKDWLFRYREGTLQPKWAEILDERLSSETKDWIYSLPSAELTGLGVGRAVTNQLVEETLYPSPHAFRHMWAEAVYRRFDGDAGWMIRSQFKHISQKN
ncbi:MAG: hypothetical protein KAG87_02620, partial [Marinobacter adhaerens]|nr:hypothetical protein [Marinobacter adhaerens]